MPPEVLRALEEFVAAGQKLTALWGEHLGTPTDVALTEHYPARWLDFDAEVIAMEDWLANTRTSNV